MTRFIGRQEELKKLKTLQKKKSASLVVIRGRRRIGKSRLIREFGKTTKCHIFSGIPPIRGATRQGQINTFCEQMRKHFVMPKIQFDSWSAVFWQLGQLCAKEEIIIALDEISWIGSKDPNFLGELKNAWDLYFSQNSKLILILCGSVSSWIEENILSSTGFVGRISLNLQLKELPIHDAVKFWDEAKKRISSQEILTMLAVTGGVPRYLEEILPNLSADKNIHRLCFDEDGILYQEFDQIFTDLFSSRSPIYETITNCLAGGTRSAQELAQRLKKSDWQISKRLKNLVQAGFVVEDPTWNLQTMKPPRLKRYRLSDNYIRFYLKVIAPNRDGISQKVFKNVPLTSLSGWDSVMGLQFENLVLNNVHSMLKMMDLNSSDLVRFGPYFQRSTQRKPGCQVDLLIQTRFRTIFLCEIKFSDNPVGMEVVHQVEEKQKRISLPKGWSTRLVLIHVNGVTREALQSGTFDHIVDFGELLEIF